jgi:hypothetical protein
MMLTVHPLLAFAVDVSVNDVPGRKNPTLLPVPIVNVEPAGYTVISCADG